MAVVKQKPNGKGSLKDIQQLINHHKDLLNHEISRELPKLNEIKWVSPCQEDDYAEYSDSDFLSKINVKPIYPLEKFWPKRGPQWDALGIARNSPILVEAKANIPELVSPGSQAGEASMSLIRPSLEMVKTNLNIINDRDWTDTFYQYTNRIAHLYYLRELNKVPAFLVNVYFINDDTVNGPKTKEEWQGAIYLLKSYLGLGRHKLSKYMIDVFIDVKDMQTGLKK